MVRPRELTRAQTIERLLKRYPAYTLGTLLAESAELLQHVEILSLGGDL